MNLNDVKVVVEGIGMQVQDKYPHGAFVNPRTLEELAAVCRSVHGPAPTLCGMMLYPLEGVPKDQLWPRAQDGTPDVAALFRTGARA